MKHTMIGLVVAGMLLGATTASAATTTPSVDQLIAQLKAQIEVLNAQLSALRSAQSSVSTSKQEVKETLKLISELREGMSGEQVTLLQSALAADASVYPEAQLSGYYGKYTKEALKRFQKKQGLPVTGKMSSSTIDALNKVLAEQRITRENGRICVPPGHLIASGWLKKEREKDNRGKGNGTIRWEKDGLLIPYCNQKGSTTPVTIDTTAPTFSAITVAALSNTSATITWTTSEQAKSVIYVGTTSPVATTTAAWTDSSMVTAHSAVLSGLVADTNYRFVVLAKDAAGNVSLSGETTFKTAVTPDTTAPVISSIVATPTSSTTATIAWTTNEAATSKVYFSTTTPVTSGAMVADAAFVTAHAMSITGLSASTTYRAIVVGNDAAGNTATSSEFMWTSL